MNSLACHYDPTGDVHVPPSLVGQVGDFDETEKVKQLVQHVGTSCFCKHTGFSR